MMIQAAEAMAEPPDTPAPPPPELEPATPASGTRGRRRVRLERRNGGGLLDQIRCFVRAAGFLTSSHSRSQQVVRK